MPFKDTKEGQTHSMNDGCGEPAHNSPLPAQSPQGEECTGCPLCDPQAYITTVDLTFLKAMRDMHDNLKTISPDHVAPFWGPEIERKIKEATSYKPSPH